MAVNGEVQIIGGKILQYNSVENTWYQLKNLKPKWWFKFDDHYTFLNNNTVPNNEYYLANAGYDILNTRTVFSTRQTKVVVAVSANPILSAVSHGYAIGTILTPIANAGGFITNTSYFVLTTPTPDTFTLSTTFTTTSVNVNPTASANVTFHKKQGLYMNISGFEGYRSVTFDHGNHINSSYLTSNLNQDLTLNNFTFYVFGRMNAGDQPLPVGVTPKRTIFSLTDPSNSSIIELYFAETTNLITLNYNGNLLNFTTTAYIINNTNSCNFVIKYDGLKLSLHSISITTPVSLYEEINLVGVVSNFSQTQTRFNIGADYSGTTALSKLYIDSFRFYERALSDEEELFLINQGDGNQFCTLYPIYQYYDYHRWQLDDVDYNLPMQQIGYINPMTPNNGSLNLLRVNPTTGVLINQIEDGIRCYRLVEANKGMLTSAIDLPILFNPTDAFTFSFWIKDVSSTNAKRRWCTNTILNSTSASNIFCIGESDTQNNILLASNNNTVNIPTTWKNQWCLFHIIFNTYKSRVELYKNCELIGTLTGLNSAYFNPSVGFYIGGKNTTSDTEYGDFFIRDIAYKQYGVNVGEMRMVYNNGIPLEV